MIDIRQPHASDALSGEELALYDLIMDYRQAEGLSRIPLSAGLTTTAGRHALDTTENFWAEGRDFEPGANLHSWSDAPYFADHSQPQNMWDAPQRIGTTYPGNGFEISAAGQSTIEEALRGWQASPGHDPVIVNSGIWERATWQSIGIGIADNDQGPYGGVVYHVWFGREVDPEGGPDFTGGADNDRFTGSAGDEVISGGLGSDTLLGGAGDDEITGGTSMADLRDVIYGGDGNDTIDGGYGNDELRGDAGDDSIAGGFGADTVIGGVGNDTLTGSAFGDVIFGGDGMDFINGGFGSDRVNGGADADAFFHLGIADHGSDWIQDYNGAEGDVLVYGQAGATRDQFQINTTTTPTAGADNVQEAFVIYRPTGQILWALVDGDGQTSITVRAGGAEFDLLA
ncbi:CAP domain-containing protein [Jannaschia sp. M317]|uniref:CAP domain-containing protein n=1 Tax=Jannaschia sp. M317 TaxID=2867011 RepID=UPI0021A40274|nr:CAP domain-containing protein [Jannaschia sp. M317]UWQ19654.1 hypothetical protein K3551_18365 [Jannaschia sp. M317]